MKPVFHPPTSIPHKLWPTDSDYPDDNCLSPCCHSLHQHSIFNPDIGFWDDMEMEMDIDAMLHSANYSTELSQGMATQWPLWDDNNSASRFIPVSAARSSLYGSPPSFGAFWRGSPSEENCSGSTSLPSSTAPFDVPANPRANKDSASFPRRQPHNAHYNSMGSPHPYYSHPYYSHASPPSADTFSPIARSNSPASSTASAPSSSSSCPPTPPTPVLLPELHQPRPERPIPIIPLSKLATVCEDYFIPSSVRGANAPKPCGTLTGEAELSLFRRYDRYPGPPQHVSDDMARLRYGGF